MVKNNNNSLTKQLWGLAIAQGVLAILFGIVALFWPGITVALLLVFFSVFVLTWGVVGVIVGLSTMNSHKFWWLEILFSVLAIGLAVYTLRNPVDAARIFILLIGFTFVVRGIIDILEGLFDQSKTGDGRVFSLIVGVLAILAGVVTLLYPVSAGVAVVWVIGLYAVLYGAFSVGFAVRAQNTLQ